MTRLLTICGLVMVILTAILSPTGVKAYEGDTHFDMMYHLARTAGYSDAVAKFMAIGNQHIDKGIISSPMLLSPQRQLFHFLGDINKVDVEGHGIINLASKVFKSKLAISERNHALGSYLIAQGMIDGDLMAFSLGLHVKMDTYGHSGFSNFFGHMDAGHNPDRAFLEVKKYEDMIRSMMQTLIAAKSLFPPEALDEASALRYLNRFAKSTHLKRDLTLEDMKDATKVAGVLFADTDMQGIYREDMFKKYEYKKLALNKIYQKFKRTGEIKPDITFEELFPLDILQNDRLDVKDVLKYTIMSSTNSEFLKNEGDKEIFDIKKLFGYKSEEIFYQKFQVEVKRADFRLRELINLEDQAKDGNLSTWLTQRLVHEQEELLTTAAGLSTQYEYGSEEFIKARAKELAEERIVDEIAIKLTKDLVPLKQNEYIKHNFEGNTETRRFEVEYKATAHRLYRIKVWASNFAYDDKVGFFAKLKDAITKFKQVITKNKTSALEDTWQRSAQKSASEYIKLDAQLAAQADQYELVGFDKTNKRDAFVKLLRYVGPAIAPWIYGYKTSYSYIQKLVAKSKAFAKDHEVEDMQKAIEVGKYKSNILEGKSSAKAVDLIQAFETRKVKLSCLGLF